jgi:hypothetical protein
VLPDALEVLQMEPVCARGRRNGEGRAKAEQKEGAAHGEQASGSFG